MDNIFIPLTVVFVTTLDKQMIAVVRHYCTWLGKAESHKTEEEKITTGCIQQLTQLCLGRVYCGRLYTSFTGDMVECKNNIQTFNSNSLQGVP